MQVSNKDLKLFVSIVMQRLNCNVEEVIHPLVSVAEVEDHVQIQYHDYIAGVFNMPSEGKAELRCQRDHVLVALKCDYIGCGTGVPIFRTEYVEDDPTAEELSSEERKRADED